MNVIIEFVDKAQITSLAFCRTMDFKGHFNFIIGEIETSCDHSMGLTLGVEREMMGHTLWMSLALGEGSPQSCHLGDVFCEGGRGGKRPGTYGT